jgi:hypothetical protein
MDDIVHYSATVDLHYDANLGWYAHDYADNRSSADTYDTRDDLTSDLDNGTHRWDTP